MKILYEDEDILAVDKPAGLVVHSDGRTKEPTLTDWFVETYPESRNVGEPIELSSGERVERPGVVHRIDRETSGVLLLAKTKRGHRCLKEQFQNREIDKTYTAFVYGSVKDDFGSISLSIARSSSDFRKRVTSKEGREALTHYKVVTRTPEASLIEAKPKTGRTHQIRVHLRAIHHPIVCDKLYAPGKPCLFGFGRLALHAREISFLNAHGEKIAVTAPYPEDFIRAIDMLG